MNEQPQPPVWLITGCSRGLGRALATHVLARGHRLVATTRTPTQLDDLVAQHPETCRALALDVTKPSQVKAAVAQAAEAFGRIDVVVNNAGCGLVGALEELSDDQITRNFDTNFFGALEVIRAALPILRPQRSGQIVNISAAAAISNYAGFSIYGAAKWALEGVSESLSTELMPLGIKVIIVQPGPFRTDFIGRSLERAGNHIADYDRCERQVPSLSRNHERQATRRSGQGGERHHRRRRIRRAAAAPGPGKVRERQGAEKTRLGCKRTRRVGTPRPRHGFHTQPMNATKCRLSSP
jgi:NAD(P)-dependent dehydrogenase (short-subunit alcohol dehydrogenase family)